MSSEQRWGMKRKGGKASQSEQQKSRDSTGSKVIMRTGKLERIASLRRRAQRWS
jgi:hypothetical protein